MMIRGITMALLVCFLLASCSAGIQPNRVASSKAAFTLTNPTFTSPDGRDVVLTGPTPDGRKARIVIPSGKGFAAATMFSADSGEPLKINVNAWINSLAKTSDTTYVDSGMEVFPLITDIGNFTMTEADMDTVNSQLASNGYKLRVTSTVKGLEVTWVSR